MKVGQWIVVPKYKESFLEKMDSVRTDTTYGNVKYPEGKKDNYNMAFMLPFELALNDSLEKTARAGEMIYISLPKLHWIITEALKLHWIALRNSACVQMSMYMIWAKIL